MSSDVDWHIRDKLRPMREHGSVLLFVHGNHKARWDGEPRTATSTLTQLLNYETVTNENSILIRLRFVPGVSVRLIFFFFKSCSPCSCLFGSALFIWEWEVEVMFLQTANTFTRVAVHRIESLRRFQWRLSRFGPAVKRQRLVSRRTSVRFRFGSLFISKVAV